MLIRYGDSPQLQPLGLLCNTENEGLFSNVSEACKLGLPEVRKVPVIMPQVVICGGGPSLADTLESIRELKENGALVFALNNAAQFLVKNGIRPDKQIIVDPRPQNVKFIEEIWADELLLCSQCAPEMFAQAKAINYPVRIWHPGTEGIAEHIPREDPCLIGGGITVGLSSLCLAFALGYRQFHLFGYDSSHAKGTSHAYSQPMNADVEMVTCTVDSRVFDCSLAMAGQAAEWENVHNMLVNEGASIKVYGDGLIPTMWRMNERLRTQRVLVAVYDLGVSPPTYDFLSFLIEAERHRIEEKYDLIDIVFQPGPMHGFRKDELPPDVETREGMLWRVCVGMARLLPSVRNVNVLNERTAVPEKNVFPVEYAENKPKSHYATAYLKGGTPMLRASEYARKQASSFGGRGYATITIRQSSYWPDRNSNVKEWAEVAAYLWERDIWPIFIPDTESANTPPLECHAGWGFCPAAAFDIDLRAALYEGAIVNLGVLNGPMSLLAYLDAKYLICKVVVETAVASTTSFLKAHGFEDGDDFGGTGRMIWKPDLAENIIPALQDFLEKTS